MENNVLGYVRFKDTGKILPYIDFDENGYSVQYDNGAKQWIGSSYFEEVHGPKCFEENPFIKSVHDIIDRQQTKGLEKYGTLVNKDDYSLLGWINHAQEEAADLLIYLEMVKAKVKDVIG